MYLHYKTQPTDVTLQKLICWTLDQHQLEWKMNKSKFIKKQQQYTVLKSLFILARILPCAYIKQLKK